MSGVEESRLTTRSSLGKEYKYRQADGSNNVLYLHGIPLACANRNQNPLYPKLGAANTPYGRTVRPQTIPAHALPDPGLIFDCVMVRKEFEPHPTQISSVLFYLASIIIHGQLVSDGLEISIGIDYPQTSSEHRTKISISL